MEQMPTLDIISKEIGKIVDFEKFSEKATIDLLLALHHEKRIPCMDLILKKNNLI